MPAKPFTLSLFLVVCAVAVGGKPAWSQAPLAGTDTVCLTSPIDLTLPKVDASEKAEAIGKSVLGSVLGGVSGGVISSSQKGTELASKPRYTKSKMDVVGSPMKLEYQGALDKGRLVLAVRIARDSNKGSPHLLALQDINCRVLMPAQVEVFELWGSGGLSVSWSSSTYQNGALVGSASGGWNTSWIDLKKRYPANSDIPGIWQSYGQPPFKGIRGVTAIFEPPDGKIFKPEDWYLVSHFTQPGATPGTITTVPSVTDIRPAKKNNLTFQQAKNVSWQAPAIAASVATGSAVFDSGQQGLVCKDDCQKIQDEINQLQCEKEDCARQRQAVNQALQDLASAQQALQDAQADAAQASKAVAMAQNAFDRAREELDRATAKLAVESQKQQRLQDSLRRGGFGLSAEQTQHATQFSQQVVSDLEARQARAQADFGQAQNNLAVAHAAVAAANSAISAAQASVEQAEQALEDARQALRDCEQRNRDRCDAIEALWDEYQVCRKRCRDQEHTRDEIDWSRSEVEAGSNRAQDASQQYDGYAENREDSHKALSGLGGSGVSSSSSAGSDESAAAKAAESSHRKARDYSQQAEHKLREAEQAFNRGELDAAERTAQEARDLQQQAEDAMNEAADEMRFAAEEARRGYESALREKQQREQRERDKAARDAALKRQVCLRYISEHQASQDANASLLKDFGGLVSGPAKDAIEQAGDYTADQEKLDEFLEKLEQQRQNLEKLLSLLNGIADNASMESRNAAFGTALEISAELAQKIPGLGEFFNFYSSAYEAAIGALYALQEEMVGKYKPLADHAIDLSRNCCSYRYDELNATTLQQRVNESWDRFERNNRSALARLSSESLRKLEDYYKNRLTIKWIKCCVQFTLDG